MRPEGDLVEELATRVLAGERRGLAQAVTLVESTLPAHTERAQRLLERILPHTGASVRVGVTGVPGVGKSTFVDALGAHLLSLGKRVAVLAIDPSSSVSGGSILGDKTRMPRLAISERAFVRPSPSSGALGGVARSTREASLLCEAAGFDVVLIETVGVGQSEIAVAGMVDVFLLLMLARAGDELQGIKRGILELADLVAITKADGDNAPHAENARLLFSQALALLHGNTDAGAPPVVTVSALESRGIEPLWQLIQQRHDALRDSGALARKRSSQRHTWFLEVLENAVRARFFADRAVSAHLAEVSAQVARAEITPEEGARRLLELQGRQG
ncbi:MAG TPA: methylmalonyl Co-A mutase-associated GTPase MeaB [Polyangiaceae bacterium]|nr:methylmalonyl Co-A mutase-associated GTPase MeaB [Polyangiaceae bacterium]